MFRAPTLLIFAPLLFAGQSLVLTNTSSSTNSLVAALPISGQIRVGFAMENWSNAATTHILDDTTANAAGLDIEYYNIGGGQQYLELQFLGETGLSSACFIFGLGTSGTSGGGTFNTGQFVNVRIQQVPGSGGSGTVLCQAWDLYGNLVTNTSQTYTGTSGSTANGITLTGSATHSIQFAWFRVFSADLSSTAIPPLTDDSNTNCLLHWKFDLSNNTGSPNDSCSAGPYNATLTNTSYTASLNQTSASTPVAVICPQSSCANNVAWQNEFSLYGVHPWDSAGLYGAFSPAVDGSYSYSQSDSSPTCSSYTWAFGSGSRAGASFTSTTASATTVTGIVDTYGGSDYLIQLTCVDSISSSTASQHIGARPLNASGAVTLTTNQKKIYLQMLASGVQPWQYNDERRFTGNFLQGPVSGMATVTNGSQSITAATGTFQVAAAGGVVTQIVLGSDPKPYVFVWASGTTGTIYPPYQGTTGTVAWKQANNYLEQAAPVWATAGTGTVAYGMQASSSCTTTLTAGITATSTSIQIANASCIPGLANLPTAIIVAATPPELIRISATTATSGAATLTVAYDGRGTSAGLWSNINAGTQVWASASSWSMGTNVSEFRINGTSSKFGTDSNVPLCPAGLPGPMGTLYYNAGTVSLSASSTTVTGTSTNWTSNAGGSYTGQVFNTTSGNATQDYYIIFVSATHNGGTAFNWWAQVSSVGGTTTLTASRPAPSDVDSGPFSYWILKNVAPALQMSYTDSVPETATYNAVYESGFCQSDTVAFGNQYYGFASWPGSATQSGQDWSIEPDTSQEQGISGAFGPNFYGTGYAHRAGALMTGLTVFESNADAVDNYWIRDPRNCGGYGCTGLELTEGGGVIGAFADLTLNSSTLLHWYDLRPWATVGGTPNGSRWTSLTCNFDDTRDTGYQQAAPVLAALFDPNSTYLATWDQDLQDIDSWNSRCKDQGATSYPSEVNSWANGALWTNGTNQVTLTPGSTTGTATTTGQNIGANCDGVDTGTAIFTNGSATVNATSGTFTTTPGVVTSIVANGRYYAFSVASSTTGTISVLWPGSTGSYSFMTRSTNLANSNTPGFLTFLSFTLPTGPDTRITSNGTYACTYNSGSNTLTLDRPWTDSGASGATSYYPYPSNLSGYGQQPYMLGIKALGMTWASSLDASLSTHYGSNASAAGQWTETYGFDYQGGNTSQGTQGMFYGRVFSFAEGVGTQSGSFSYEIPGSAFGLQITSIVAARELNQEAFNSLGALFTSAPYISNRNLLDVAYGALWCQTSLTSSSAYCDANAVGNNPSSGNLTNAYLSIYKWYGFFFGIGMSQEWPAQRLGTINLGSVYGSNGVSPASVRP